MLSTIVPVVLLSVLGSYVEAAHVQHTTPPPLPTDERLQRLEDLTNKLARQLLLQQFYVEEKSRSEGDSGLKQLRMRQDGMKTYDVASFGGASMAAIHDHSNLERTCGLGEMIAVLNGLEFRTRHNDYKVKMPMHNKTYNGIVDIPFPDVPPSVLSKHTMEEQAAELKEYFKAWRDMDHQHRDYRPYFKPVLCYLEGAWTLDKDLSEPFVSDRHSIDASSWFDLQEKIRYTSAMGDRLRLQNYAFLPTTLHNVSDGNASFAQWNYRILCHPLKKPVNVSHLVPLEDLGHRMMYKMNFDKYLQSRRARFTVDEEGTGDNRHYQWNELDDWMAEIPGKDNYGAKAIDDSFNTPKMTMDLKDHINVAYYHRRWRVSSTDAMGDDVGHRGFADRNLFIAETTQPRIAPSRLKLCHRHNCQYLEKRVSYAIPLEVVFMTPLQTWNPYNIQYHGKYNEPEASEVEKGGRNGGVDAHTAFNGTHSKAYFYTPAEFFHGREVAHDPADTTKAVIGVLDRNGQVRKVKESGFRTLLPNIEGVGVLRTRYPIMPVHVEGSPIWKELEAMRDLVMDLDGNHMFLTKPPQGLKIYHAQPSHSHP